MSFQWQMISGRSQPSEGVKTRLEHARTQKQPRLKSSRLPPKMKCVQRAARAAGASGSGAQASGSEAVS